MVHNRLDVKVSSEDFFGSFIIFGVKVETVSIRKTNSGLMIFLLFYGSVVAYIDMPLCDANDRFCDVRIRELNHDMVNCCT